MVFVFDLCSFKSNDFVCKGLLYRILKSSLGFFYSYLYFYSFPYFTYFYLLDTKAG